MCQPSLPVDSTVGEPATLIRRLRHRACGPVMGWRAASVGHASGAAMDDGDVAPWVAPADQVVSAVYEGAVPSGNMLWDHWGCSAEAVRMARAVPQVGREPDTGLLQVSGCSLPAEPCHPLLAEPQDWAFRDHRWTPYTLCVA